MEKIIQKIEYYYHQYFELTSNVTLNLHTNSIINRIEALPQCKQILDDLKRKYTITDKEFDSLSRSEIHEYKRLFDSHDMVYYAAFCYQWCIYKKANKKFCLKTYADEARWLTKTDKDLIDKVKIFKTDIIRPIVDYVISQLKEEHLILYYLDRYKSRVERYTYSILTEKLNNLDKSSKKELYLQNDLALYLFDQELPFYHEPNLGHGIPDFVIESKENEKPQLINLECNNKPFVIEVKWFKNPTQNEIDTSLRQLKAYIDRLPSYGCLYIFTEDDDYSNYEKEIDDKLTIKCVYLGGKSPSQLKS